MKPVAPILCIVLAGCASTDESVSYPAVSPDRYDCGDDQIHDAVDAVLRAWHESSYWDQPDVARSAWRTFYRDGMRYRTAGNPNMAVPGPPRQVAASARIGEYDSRVVRVRYRVRIAGREGNRGLMVEADVKQKKQNRLATIRTKDYPGWVRRRAASVRRDIGKRLSHCLVPATP